MYKLLVTTALVAITATSASAWQNADEVITKLHDTYTNLDGQTEFDTLQKSGGELNTFLNDVNAGVSHLSLTVDDNNQITAEITPGKLLSEIQTSANDLVQRVNYDIFVEDGVNTTFDVAAVRAGTVDYTGQTDLVLAPIAGSDPVGYTSSFTNGLLGRKVVAVVDGVEDINDILIGTDPTQSGLRSGIQAAWDSGTGTYGDADIATIQADINKLNNATKIIGGTAGDGLIGEGLDGITFDGDTLNLFNVPGITADGQVQLAGDTVYTSLYDWAVAQPDPVAP